MAQWKKADFGPGFIKAEDFLRKGKWREFTLTIAAVHPPNTLKTGEGKLIEKRVVEFKETPKRLVIGAQNAQALILACGDASTDQWIGRQITLYPIRQDAFGQKNIPGVRVRIPRESSVTPFRRTDRKAVDDLTGTSHFPGQVVVEEGEGAADDE